jgi:carbamoyl-phosphate synthase small subunit
VQYHPEAAAGPHDANYLFDRFRDMVLERRTAPDTAAESGTKESGTKENGTDESTAEENN